MTTKLNANRQTLFSTGAIPPVSTTSGDGSMFRNKSMFTTRLFSSDAGT